jgi:hypothetical protein
VGLALFGMARTLEQGQSKPAAEALDGLLTQLLRVALDFLARTFGLDKLPKLLRVGLQALRRPVEKGVNGVLDKIIKLARKAWQGVKKGGVAVARAGKQAVGTVKDWLGFRAEFTLPDGEKHTLFFREDGQLMLASDPMPYLRFLLQFEQQHTVAPGQQVRQQSDVRQVAVSIQTLRAERQKLESQQQAEQAANAGKTSPALLLLLHQNENTLNDLMQQLSRRTYELMQATVTGKVAKDSPVHYGGFSQGGFGKGVLVEYLTQNGARGGTPTGDIPAGLGGKNFTALAQRRTKSGLKAYYRMGHLLNAELGGPGDKWENLTPLSPSGNGLHSKRVEEKLHGKRRDANSNATEYAFFYSVVPQYAHPLRGDLKQKAQAEKTAESQKAQPNQPLMYHWAAVAAIVEAEQFVPRSLTCFVQQIDPITRQKAGDLTMSVVLDNLIDQSSIEAYGTPFRPTSAMQKPTRELFINKNRDAELLQSPLLLGITADVATVLVKQVVLTPLSGLKALETFLTNHSKTADLTANLAAARTAHAAERLRYGR